MPPRGTPVARQLIAWRIEKCSQRNYYELPILYAAHVDDGDLIPHYVVVVASMNEESLLPGRVCRSVDI